MNININMGHDNMKIKIGDKILEFDSRLYVDDEQIPLSLTMQDGVIVDIHTEELNNSPGKYIHIADIRFDWKPEDISHGHLVDVIKKIDE